MKVKFPQNEQLSIRRLTLYDVKNQKELQYEVIEGKPLTLDCDLNLIKLGFSTSTTSTDFNILDLDTAEKYLLTDLEYQLLKNKLGELHNPKEYPSIVKV